MYTNYGMRALTARQKEVLKFLESWNRRYGYSPTVREIAEHFGIQLNAVARHLRALEGKGVIERRRGRARALAIVSSPESSSRSSRFASPVIPLVAAVPAGLPRAVEEHADEFIELSPEWFGSGVLRAVRVSGDSMSGDAIRDGDIAIIRVQPSAEPGDIVAVRIAGEEITLKHLRRSRSRWIELVPSNPDYPVRRVPAQNVEIIGKLVGIIRRGY